MSFVRAGGWMKYKKAFTILESIIYIFLSTIILMEGINMCISIYKVYVDIRNSSIRANEYKNFYINLNNIISEGGLENIVVGDDYILLCKGESSENIRKKICLYEKKIVISYSDERGTLTYNNMLYDIKEMKVIKKENLIYVKIYDENGEEFICCI